MSLYLQMIEYLFSYFTRISIQYYIIAFFLGGLMVIVLKIKYKSKHIMYAQLAAIFILIVYIFMVLTSTVFSRTSGNNFKYNLYPFSSYREVMRTGDVITLWEVYYNIIMMMPYGFLLPMSGNKINGNFIIVTGMFFSIIIELLQLVLRRGLFEIDDIIHNTLGVIIGYLIYHLFTQMHSRVRKQRNKMKYKKVLED